MSSLKILAIILTAVWLNACAHTGSPDPAKPEKEKPAENTSESRTASPDTAESQPQEVQDLVEQEQARILSGEFDVFVGPINDNTGELRVPDGETMSDEDKLSFDWLVEGVVGEIPQ